MGKGDAGRLPTCPAERRSGRVEGQFDLGPEGSRGRSPAWAELVAQLAM